MLWLGSGQAWTRDPLVRPGLKAPGYATTPAEAGLRGASEDAHSADVAEGPLTAVVQ